MADMTTFQSNIHNHKLDLTKYALFLGGLDVTRPVLEQYDPLTTGYGRLFMIRTPIFLGSLIPEKLKKFKHILEYANIGVSGNNNITVNTEPLRGGYAGKQMEIPTIATDDANELTIRVYEFSGSPVREVIQYWVNGVTDFQSGYATYYRNSANINDTHPNQELEISQANHTAEFIYVVTDRSGLEVEYAALFANCFPKEVRFDQFNYEAGTHEIVSMDLTVTCSRYISPLINARAKDLIGKYNILMNSLNFHPKYFRVAGRNVTGDNAVFADGNDNGTKYDITTGKITNKDANNRANVVITQDNIPNV